MPSKKDRALRRKYREAERRAESVPELRRQLAAARERLKTADVTRTGVMTLPEGWEVQEYHLVLDAEMPWKARDEGYREWQRQNAAAQLGRAALSDGAIMELPNPEPYRTRYRLFALRPRVPQPERPPTEISAPLSLYQRFMGQAHDMPAPEAFIEALRSRPYMDDIALIVMHPADAARLQAENLNPWQTTYSPFARFAGARVEMSESCSPGTALGIRRGDLEAYKTRIHSDPYYRALDYAQRIPL